MAQRPITHKPFGDAGFADGDELKAHGLLGDAPEAVPFGFGVEEGRPTRQKVIYNGERHSILFGPNGSGKSLRVAASMLLKAERRSFVVIDPKGELAAITAPFRRSVGEVYVVNPFGTLADLSGYDDLASCGFNPLSALDPASPSFNAEAGLLAEALITMEGTQPFFPRSARNLIAALIMWEVLGCRAERERGNIVAPSLGNVRDMLTAPGSAGTEKTPPDGLYRTIAEMALCSHRGIRNKASPMLQESRSIRDVISEAATQTEFLDDSELADDLTKPSLDFHRLRDQPVTVYVILPATMMERHTKWLRLVLSSALSSLMAPRTKGQLPVTFLLDEFFPIANGGLKIIETVWAYVRGYGIQIIPILQDLNQLQDLYPKRWQTFLSNAGVVASFGPTDLTTAEWMARRAGETTDYAQSISDQEGQGFQPDHKGGIHANFNRGGGVSWSQTRVPFLDVHTLLNTPEGRLYVWKNGLANTVLTEAPLYVDPRLGLKGRARANPYFSK